MTGSQSDKETVPTCSLADEVQQVSVECCSDWCTTWESWLSSTSRRGAGTRSVLKQKHEIALRTSCVMPD